ncbi:hypothetical protein F2P81_005833 [Scophthalmus maximus]|uniref:Uncharacterized protein n=1 Tax=Scophthalmus maximus TaxID=52904 RepID=A0A6A4THI1_SCOMX|nr:hypothetical protein F2P81_005833 [Scophthalmus maximus]
MERRTHSGGERIKTRDGNEQVEEIQRQKSERRGGMTKACALVQVYRSDFDSLKKENVYENNKLERLSIYEKCNDAGCSCGADFIPERLQTCTDDLQKMLRLDLKLKRVCVML